MAVFPIHLDHQRIRQAAVLGVIAEDDPPIGIASFPPARPRHVDRLVVAEAEAITLPEDGHRAHAGVGVQEAIAAARRIVRSTKRDEEDGAERDPQRVDPEKSTEHARYHTQP